MAGKILEGLDSLAGKFECSAKRWIWELIQNAKDASIGEAPVKIEIFYTDEYVEFKHSGKPFTIENLLYLMRQTSTKNRMKDEVNLSDVQETTGKFGTGFITTMLLSKKIEI